MVFFDSYESGMENSNLADTQEFADQEDVRRPPVFYDLDTVGDRPQADP